MKGFRTIVFNLLMAIGGFITIVGGEAPQVEEQSIMDLVTSAEAIIIEIWTVGNLYLRAITDTKIFNKE